MNHLRILTKTGTVFLADAGTMLPYYNAAGAYAAGDPIAGALTPAYNASLGI